MFGTLDWEDPYGKELNTSGIKAYGRAKLQVTLFGDLAFGWRLSSVTLAWPWDSPP